MTESHHTTLTRLGAIAGLVGVFLLACLMPTSDSFWIDETSTRLYASEPTLSALQARILADRGSEAQMPLGMLAFWMWDKAAGSSEWSFRALNIVWVLVAAAALFLTGRRLELPTLPFWLILQPFVWFYANEARPYLMQIAGAAWLLHGMIVCLQTRASGSFWAVAWISGALLVTGASMLGAVALLAAAAITGGFLAVNRLRPTGPALLILGAGFLLLAPLGLYFLHTLRLGAGGAKLWSVGGHNVAFAGYELAGFLGLGPGRLEIREAARAGLPALAVLFTPYCIGLGLLALLYILLVLSRPRALGREHRPAIALVAGHAALTAALLLVAGHAAGFPFWGRHAAPLLPAWALLVGWTADRSSGGSPVRPAAFLPPLALALILLASSLSIRFAERHRKDDYRRAAAIARKAAGLGARVGWAADSRTARYYGVPFVASPGHAGVFEIPANLAERFDSAMADPLPDPIILSKPDLFDPAGRLDRWLDAHRYQRRQTFPGFSVWVRPAVPHS